MFKFWLNGYQVRFTGYSHITLRRSYIHLFMAVSGSPPVVTRLDSYLLFGESSDSFPRLPRN